MLHSRSQKQVREIFLVSYLGYRTRNARTHLHAPPKPASSYLEDKRESVDQDHVVGITSDQADDLALMKTERGNLT